ncbi:hypothetical protein HK101_009341 [Irineochytrium annulatum]|nr:hypothetical protein HK101_009341 [Irineochytrium annulatum]
MADEEQNIASFVGLTGCTADQAKFYLQAHKGDMNGAVSAYFASQEQGGEGMEGDDDEDADDGDVMDNQPAPQRVAPGPSSSGNPSSSSARGTGNISTSAKMRTLRDIMNSGDDEEEEERENFFAGGEKSGVMMQGGPKDKKKATDLVKDILSKAQKAQPHEDEPERKKPLFQGSGYRLGSEEDAAKPPAPRPAPGPNAPEEPEKVDRRLTFWRDGFSIEDGPLLKYDDPKNQEFLSAINSGRAPTALLNVQYGQPVEVKVEHRMEEDYRPPPKRPAQAFSGSGFRLGAEAGASSGGGAGSGVSMPGGFPGGSSGVSAARPAAAPTVPAPVVDESAPMTSVQIRLADGSKLVAKLNHSHTIADLRNFILHNRPELGGRSFILQTTFPNKELTDSSLTLKDAGLLNAVVVQRNV